MKNVAFYRYSDVLSKLKTDGEKISWIEGRVKQVLIDPLEELRKVWQKNEEIQCLNLGVMTLLCCGIEALSNFYLQKGESGKKFKKFVENYMNAEFRRKDPSGKKYSSFLWDDFRCGLAHGFSIEKGGILEGTNRYVRFDDKKGLGIDLWFFFEDFKHAFTTFINDVRKASKDSILRNNFLARFDILFAKGQKATR